MKQVHYISGILISSFIGLHLFNHLLSLFGAACHIEFMQTLRVVYRNFIIEGLIFTAVAIQIISGIKLFIKKRKMATLFYEKLQISSGLYLAFFLIIHVGAVLSGRLVLQLDTNFYFGVAGLNTFPSNLFFIPYYALAIMGFFAHIASIHSLKMKTRVFGLSANKQAHIILAVGGALTICIFYGLTNGFNGVEIPEAYKILVGK
ncbi:hypothetical protein [Carboxylicivirga taeanensis]|uniref:hypothetical protein n=1 Tax=Carboxylicivirga taeanensis TaxID=1416875 RepID=UPI003F6DAC9A